ncbi:DUF2778 domain-containing protein [Microvirga subterranea]|uniref:Uncharacterized protein DUF2778 n=1 Tax=Microvirga subterranea TaxID=186651 RepID=A0A370HN82_9HYPH|nr:DUF2778 domain-containing protein [Microvirga subterranea]RDI60022.1 uncharacterized protein DUF2778 [Microvirga subterranea]
MVQNRVSSGRRAKRPGRRNLILTAALAAASLSPALFFVGGIDRSDGPPLVSASVSSDRAQMQQVAGITPAVTYDRSMVDPSPVVQPSTFSPVSHVLPATAFKSSPRQLEAKAEPPVVSPQPEPDAPPQPPQTVKAAEVAQLVPLPVPRPPEFRAVKSAEVPRTAAAPAMKPVTRTVAAITPADDRSFIEKLFGIQRTTPPPSALSYAALESPGIPAPGARSGLGSIPSADSATAVYDISAQVVYMPNGERLEAHSGLGGMLDDPRYVHVRMRGATPPGTYTLTEREHLFHGVRAIRLNPVGGSAAIHGRDGLLAHTYMLGPNGDSNGCVSFKNYDRFLQAFLRGDVKRMVVVAGRKQDFLPRMVNDGSSMPHRS